MTNPALGPSGANTGHHSGIHLVSASVREQLVDRARLESLFVDETLRLRRLYLAVGSPQIVYLSGAGLHELSATTPVSAAGAAVYEAFMAELLLAQGSTGQAMAAAITHLMVAERHISSARVREDHRARILAKVFWLKAIVEKSLGKPEDALHTLRTSVVGPWWSQWADLGDIIAITRQRAMMQRSVSAHLSLAEQAHVYRSSRPIEYFRTLKRTFEVLANEELVHSAERIRPHLVAAHAAVADQLPAISRVSLVKNLAQVDALAGDPARALHQLRVVRGEAVRLGLRGQVRQVDELSRRISAAELHDALATFRTA